MSLTDAALQHRLDEVYNGPEGPSIGAFFDFDGTLIHGFSAVDFYVDRIRRGKVGPVEGLQTIALALRGITTEEDFERFVGVGLGTFKGRPEEEILTDGDRVFRASVASRIFPEAWQLVEAHQRKGHTVVLASSATRFQIQPAADVLGIRHVLYTPLEVDEAGNLTGRPGKTLWRSGKAVAVREFAVAQEIDLENSYGYSNGDEDIPFLELVGHPAATTSEPRLRAHALEQGWPILDFRARGIPGLRDFLRSGAAVGGLTTGMFTGAAFGLLNRSRRRAVDTMAALSSELSLGLAGVQVEVQGEEHLWS
ncbi:MAG: HAD-IB family hydrolase, partial [Dermatophilaceae bacterium]